ncbi:unnamed protein product [Lepeophtheirus salmonis]|uniref:(salmon louse) hypothetical protein n=1 Tax=Lepeophtheirus salmonis TaxID=72036 RepID=A0A7R8H172_LEPSM|nr:unnamed protein product [Lepeophtheirus salmonis]CAF2783343.1 unnamed protein product [Lepeophtheirus salmonis]
MHMGGVDKADQLVSTRIWDRKSPTKFYLRLHFDYFEQVFVNASIAYKKKIAPISSAKDFRMSLVKGMVGDFTSRNRVITPASVQNFGTPLHLPSALPKRKRCVACRAIRIDKNATMGCTPTLYQGLVFCLQPCQNCYLKNPGS